MNGKKPTSPFIWRGPLVPEEHEDLLIPRADMDGNDLVDNVCNDIQNGTNVAILASSKTGRTTLLHQIRYRLEHSPVQINPLIINCGFEKNTEDPYATFYEHIAKQILTENKEKQWDTESFLDFMNWVSHSRKMPSLLMFDQMDEVPDEICDAFFTVLRSLYSEMKRQHLPYILTGTEHLRWVETYSSLEISPLFNILHDRRLGDCSRSDIEEWIGEISKKYKIHFTSGAVSAIYESTSGHPYFIQKICDFAYQRADDNRITQKEIEKIKEDILERDGLLIQVRQDVRSDEEARLYIAEILKKEKKKFRPLSRPISKLLAYGIIANRANRDGDCEIRNSLYKEAIKRIVTYEEANVKIITRPVRVDDKGDIFIPISIVNYGPKEKIRDPNEISEISISEIIVEAKAVEFDDRFHQGKPWTRIPAGEHSEPEPIKASEICKKTEESAPHVSVAYANGDRGIISSAICPLFPFKKAQAKIKKSKGFNFILQFDEDWLFNMMNISFATYHPNNVKEMQLPSFDMGSSVEVFEALNKHYLPNEPENTFEDLIKTIPTFEKLTEILIPIPKRYQDYFAHSLRMTYLGEYLLNCQNKKGHTLLELLCQYINPSFKDKSTTFQENQKERILKTWWIIALFHDVGELIEKALAGKTDREAFAAIVKTFEVPFKYEDREKEFEEVCKVTMEKLGLKKVKPYVKPFSHGVIGAYLLMEYCQRVPWPERTLPFDLKVAARAIFLHDLEAESSTLFICTYQDL